MQLERTPKQLHKDAQEAVRIEKELWAWFTDEDTDPAVAAQACLLFAARIALRMGKCGRDFGALARRMFRHMSEEQKQVRQ